MFHSLSLCINIFLSMFHWCIYKSKAEFSCLPRVCEYVYVCEGVVVGGRTFPLSWKLLEKIQIILFIGITKELKHYFGPWQISTMLKKNLRSTYTLLTHFHLDNILSVMTLFSYHHDFFICWNSKNSKLIRYSIIYLTFCTIDQLSHLSKKHLGEKLYCLY